MKLQSKSIIVLLGTLVIGVVIGALGQSTLHNRRMDKLAEMRRQGGLYASVDRYIDPVDMAQEDTLRALSKSYQSKLGRFYRHYQWHRSRLMDSLRTDMIPLLNPEQVEQISPWFERSAWNPRTEQKDSTAQNSTGVSADSTTANASAASQDSTLSN